MTLSPTTQGLDLRFGGDDITQHPTGQAPAFDFEAIREEMVDSQTFTQGSDDLDEAPGDDTEDAPLRMKSINERLGTRSRVDLSENLAEDRLRHTLQGCDALAKGLREVDLPVHRPGGHLGNESARACSFGEFFNDFFRDKGRINIRDNEERMRRRRGPPERFGVREDLSVQVIQRVTTMPFGTIVIPDSVTVNPR